MASLRAKRSGWAPAIEVGPVCVIGRAESCDFRIPDERVAAWHCLIERRDGLYRLRRLDGAPVLVNGERPRVHVQRLAHGDELTVAHEVLCFALAPAELAAWQVQRAADDLAGGPGPPETPAPLAIGRRAAAEPSPAAGGGRLAAQDTSAPLPQELAGPPAWRLSSRTAEVFAPFEVVAQYPQRLRKDHTTLRALFELFRQIELGASDASSAARTLVSAFRQLVTAERSALFLVDRAALLVEGHAGTLAVRLRVVEPPDCGSDLEREAPLLREAALCPEGLLCHDVRHDFHGRSALAGSVLVVPLRSPDGGLRALLWADAIGLRHFGEAARQVALVVAGIVGRLDLASSF